MNSATYKLQKLIRDAKVTNVTGGDYFDEEITINSDYVKSLLGDLEEVRGAVTQIVAQTDKSACSNFIMFFINQFHQSTGDLIDYLNVTGESLLDDDQIRTYLTKIQFTFIKIASIYEAYHSQEYPNITFLLDYMVKHRTNVIDTVLAEVEDRKRGGLSFEDERGLQENQFKSELVEYQTVIHIKTLRILFLYYTLYQASLLEPPVKEHVTNSIARAIYLITKIQKQVDISTNTLHMKPSDLLHDLYQIFSELKVFIHFTPHYIQNHEYKTQFQPAPPLLIEPLKDTQTPKGTIEIFTNRDCPICKDFFNTALWTFIQKVARKLSLQIKLYDISNVEDEALCKGIYDIQRVPTLKYKDKLFWLNPASEEGPDPYRKAFREVMNFFGILGLYTYEITSHDGPSEKNDEEDRTIRVRINPLEGRPSELTKFRK